MYNALGRHLELVVKLIGVAAARGGAHRYRELEGRYVQRGSRDKCTGALGEGRGRVKKNDDVARQHMVGGRKEVARGGTNKRGTQRGREEIVAASRGMR